MQNVAVMFFMTKIPPRTTERIKNNRNKIKFSVDKQKYFMAITKATNYYLIKTVSE